MMSCERYQEVNEEMPRSRGENRNNPFKVFPVKLLKLQGVFPAAADILFS